MRQNDVGEPPVTACGQLRSCDSVGKVTPIPDGTTLRHSLLRGGRHPPRGREAAPVAFYHLIQVKRGRMRKDVRELIRKLEAVGLTVEPTPGHYRVLRDGRPPVGAEPRS